MMRYIQDLKNLALHPKKFFKKPLPFSYSQSLQFYISVFSLTAVINYVSQMLQTQRTYPPFVVINQIIFSLPFALLGIFFMAVVFYYLSRALGGKGTFKQTFALVIFTEWLIIFTPIPWVKIVWLYSLYLTVLALKNTHQYGWAKSILVLLIPGLLFVLIIEVIDGPRIINLFR